MLRQLLQKTLHDPAFEPLPNLIRQAQSGFSAASHAGKIPAVPNDWGQVNEVRLFQVGGNALHLLQSGTCGAVSGRIKDAGQVVEAEAAFLQRPLRGEEVEPAADLERHGSAICVT